MTPKVKTRREKLDKLDSIIIKNFLAVNCHMLKVGRQLTEETTFESRIRQETRREYV